MFDYIKKHELLLKIIMAAFTLIFGVQKKAVFISYDGKQYACNPKAISEKLHELDSDYKIVWLFNEPQEKDVPSYIKKVKHESLRAYYEIATSNFFIYNTNINVILNFKAFKKKEQLYIQTWHGDRPLKKVGYNAGTKDKNFGKNYNLLENQLTDVSIAGSVKGEAQYRNSFKYRNKIWKTGCPRNDILISKNISSKKIKDILNIDKNINVLLYAPTFRDTELKKPSKAGQGTNQLDFMKIIAHLEKNTGKEWKVLVKGHPLVKNMNITFNNKIINVVNYEDVGELLTITDILITDYSSIAGDFVITGKPVILYLKDLEEYRKESRDFCFNIEDIGFLYAKSMTGLLKTIDGLNEDVTRESSKRVVDFFGIYDMGNASEKIVKRILGGNIANH